MEKQTYFFLKTKFENQELNKDDTEFFELVKNMFNWKEYMSLLTELGNKGFFSERNRSFLSEYGKSILNELELKILQQEKDEQAERFKLHNESIMSGWKRKTFWYIFALGLFGGIYSAYDLFNKITSSKEVPIEQITKQEMEGELSKLRTLILTQKKKDSLKISNSELNK